MGSRSQHEVTACPALMPHVFIEGSRSTPNGTLPLGSMASAAQHTASMQSHMHLHPMHAPHASKPTPVRETRPQWLSSQTLKTAPLHQAPALLVAHAGCLHKAWERPCPLGGIAGSGIRVALPQRLMQTGRP